MNNKSLLVLSIVTIVIIAAAVITSQSRAPRTEIETSELFPGLERRVNEVAAVIVQSPEGLLHVNKRGGDWLVAEADDYPARFEKVKGLVLGAAVLEILSEKTSNPALFAELGVEDPAAAGATSTLLTLADDAGNGIASLILGNPRTGGGSGGQFVRKAGADQALLVNGTLETSLDPRDWIVRDLLDVPAERVMEVNIRHPDGAAVTLRRPEGEENFSVTDPPERKESRSQYFTNQPAGFLSALTIDGVKARDNFNFTDAAVTTVIRTYDGLVAEMTAEKAGGENHVTLNFNVDESLADAAADTGEAIVIGDQPENRDVRAEAAELNERVSGWVYIVPQSKYLLVVKRPEDLLKDVEADTPVETESG